MRIIVDIRPLLERGGGVAAFTRGALAALAARGANDYVAFGNALAGREPLLPAGVASRFRRFPNKILNAAFAAAGHPTFESLAGHADGVFLPNANFFSTKLPYCAVVHDLSFARMPHFFTAKQRLWHAAVRPKALYRDARAVVAVSQHTKDDACGTLGIDPAKVTVANPGVDDIFFAVDDAPAAELRSRLKLPDRFILSLSTLEPRKNIEGLIMAHERMAHDIPLVIAGPRGWLYERIFRTAERSRKKHLVRFLGAIPENEKAALLRAATVFAYPSFYEGFGLPPLEAMASGTPVVAGATSSLYEVVGDAGLLANPHDVASIAAALDMVTADDALCAAFAAKGRERARRFTWDATAAGIEQALTTLAA